MSTRLSINKGLIDTNLEKERRILKEIDNWSTIKIKYPYILLKIKLHDYKTWQMKYVKNGLTNFKQSLIRKMCRHSVKKKIKSRWVNETDRNLFYAWILFLLYDLRFRVHRVINSVFLPSVVNIKKTVADRCLMASSKSQELYNTRSGKKYCF